MYKQLLKMITTTHTLRVRYAETDSMKYVYYGNYATYLETARVELFRSLGISYKEIESQGIWLPVSEYKMRYLKPAFYDDEITIITKIKKIPGVKVLFEYELFNQKNEKISEAETTLYFYDSEKKKVCKCPDFLMKILAENWNPEPS